MKSNQHNIKVGNGDTLGKIAKREDTNINQILEDNPDIKDPDEIYIGEQIVITTIQKSGLPLANHRIKAKVNGTDHGVYSTDQYGNLVIEKVKDDDSVMLELETFANHFFPLKHEPITIKSILSIFKLPVDVVAQQPTMFVKGGTPRTPHPQPPKQPKKQDTPPSSPPTVKPAVTVVENQTAQVSLKSECWTDWTKGYGRNITTQNVYNDIIAKAAKQYDIDCKILKSLFAQESNLTPKIANISGFAGIAQMSEEVAGEAELNYVHSARTRDKSVIESAKKDHTKLVVITYMRVKDPKTKKYVKIEDQCRIFDIIKDDRFDVKKAIMAGAKTLSTKRMRINSLFLNTYKSTLTTDEQWAFYLAAYNGGEGTVYTAYKKIKDDTPKPQWIDIIEGGKDSALYDSIPENWGQDRKYIEISEYVENILKRKNQ